MIKLVFSLYAQNLNIVNGIHCFTRCLQILPFIFFLQLLFDSLQKKKNQDEEILIKYSPVFTIEMNSKYKKFDRYQLHRARSENTETRFSFIERKSLE